jgi:hypothetical protein
LVAGWKDFVLDSPLSDAAWLERRADLLFTLDADGRMTAGRDPTDPPPRVFIQRSATSVEVRLRHDIAGPLAREIAALTALEPPAPPPDGPLHCLEDLQSRLSGAEVVGGGPVYEMPTGATYPYEGELITSGQGQGAAVLETWRREGLPAAISALGFTDADDVWRPWCIITVGGEVAAICQTARLSDRGAEAGVITVPSFRGRGLAAAVTAAWSRHPALGQRTLYYSTSEANRSSQQVAARLGLFHRAQDLRLR